MGLRIRWPGSWPSQPVVVPASFALYYGWPSAVNGASGAVDAVVETFARFPVLVLGDGLQQEAHPDHAATATVLQRLEASATRVFGYVDLGIRTQNLPVATVLSYAQAWRGLGVAGIFLDDAGADFGVDLARRREVVAALHRVGLRVILNAHAPADALAEAVGLRPGDGYLFESFLISDGHVEPTRDQLAKADQTLRLAAGTGVDVYAVATGPEDDPLLATKRDYAWWMCALYGFKYFQYTTIDYGAGAARLTAWQPEPPDLGSRYLDETVEHLWESGTHRRRTDRGEIRVTSGPALGGAFIPRS